MIRLLIHLPGSMRKAADMKNLKRKFTILIFFLFAGLKASAQSEKEDLAIAEAIFGKTKKNIIAEHIQLNDQDQQGFWKLYDEYESKAMAISGDRLKLIEQYASGYNSLSDESASSIAKLYLNNTTRYNELYKEYLKKFERQVGGLRAATVIQLEIYIQTAIQANLQQQIPLIGDLLK